ncbi:phenylalanine--tRNA ligase subunit beta [Kurthia sibirica]|uniref:Phenylalanine--tRNA ligase beta subunit n=1 Tax=Kurthia sibirica TaxID=202750 RepID=A0A2U3ANP1_9BACL|nr:phenylalanine--tRNA ligase subunit beta [Kurthia sibirica]PWI26158.1 phenylalanine--tRNA ligase subunit beta [Kurthia sibirica]GEK33417.1 phenylalanine--tRNA ligase beta subunit [Kurthia sibirica]
MYVSLKWLSKYVDISGIEPQDLAEKITRSGIEVEGIDYLSAGLKKLMVGEIKEKTKHPEADKLNICQVDFGEEELSQIVCGAPNVAVGQKVIVARPGAHLPGGKIKKAKLRGEVSHGMICSLQELGIEGKLVPKAYADGIYILPAETPVGADPVEVLGLDDIVLELGLTPNRSDAMSMLGVAYEVAAILERDITLPKAVAPTIAKKAADVLTLSVEAPQQNPMYAAKVVQNVKVGESPLWLQQALMAVGVRPHNNIVDITNYILMEYGQPLHAFDYDALGTGEIVVRLAHEGEKITTLDQKERSLKATNLVITNGKVPVAVAGVMGGLDSEVTADTTTVVIESAYFDGLSVRYTSKDLGLRSDASARFEKGIDPNRILPAAERAAQMMAELAGGEVLEGTVLFDELDKKPARIAVSPDFINARLGMKISLNEMVTILNRLRFHVETANGLLIIDAPTRRQDIKIEEDIVEEIARIYGYDEIPKTVPMGETTAGGLTPYQAKRRLTRHHLEGSGLYQALTYSLTSQELAQKYALETADTTRLLMPMSEDHSTLRQSLLPHLIDSTVYNVSRQAPSVAMYEIGSVFLGLEEDGLPHQEEHLSLVMTGKWVDHAWQGEQKSVDFYVLKGVIESLLEKLALSEHISYEAAVVDGLHPGRTASILLDGKRVGFFGQLHPKEQKELGLKDTYVAEINFATITAVPLDALIYTPVPRFPSMSRDIALVVDRTIEAGTIETVIKNAGGKLLKSVQVFDLYEGSNMPDDKKSLAFTLKYFDAEKTLTDVEVVEVHEKVLAALTETVNAELR